MCVPIGNHRCGPACVCWRTSSPTFEIHRLPGLVAALSFVPILYGQRLPSPWPQPPCSHTQRRPPVMQPTPNLLVFITAFTHTPHHSHYTSSLHHTQFHSPLFYPYILFVNTFLLFLILVISKSVSLHDTVYSTRCIFFFSQFF